MGEAPVTATDIRDALDGRWPAAQHVVIHEAPEDAARMGRKLDVLVVSCWKSRGYALDGVEVKVSYSDWKKERDNPAKADWWWSHVHRFWVAAPKSLALRIRNELPEAWGLLAVNEGRVSELVAAPRHDPDPLPWPTCVGLFRASANAGLRALERARDGGYSAGLAKGRSEATGTDKLDRLLADVKAAEEATGIPIAAWTVRESWGFREREEIHAAVERLVNADRAEDAARRSLGYARDNMSRALASVEEAAAGLLRSEQERNER